MIYGFTRLRNSRLDFANQSVNNRLSRIYFVTVVGSKYRRDRFCLAQRRTSVEEMSIVGPRPERPVFVEELRRVFPFYQKRLTIKPGLTGWAQVKLEYDTDMESVANKLRYDLMFGIFNRSDMNSLTIV